LLDFFAQLLDPLIQMSQVRPQAFEQAPESHAQPVPYVSTESGQASTQLLNALRHDQPIFGQPPTGLVRFGRSLPN
jgi:hypothetical protein